MTSTSGWSSHWSIRSFSTVDVPTSDYGDKKPGFLSFLATLQALGIEILSIGSDAGREAIGFGGTSTINESLIDLHNSFAFKLIDHHGSEENIFGRLINETAVLGHVFVRDHPNIARLQGISWDISPKDDIPWPVLIFEKTHHGDLFGFLSLPVGRELGFSERLELCVQVGVAISDMHDCGIVHGDVKPQNVLIFGDETSKYNAKVIDFGFSSLHADVDHRIQLALSHPWNPPEHDRSARQWTPAQAKRVDIFSYAMLCLWTLFEKHLRGVVPLPSQVPSWAMADFYSTEGIRPVQDILTSIKMRGDKLVLFIGILLAAETSLDMERRSYLESFFQSSLSLNPEVRDSRLEDFLCSMSAKRLRSLAQRDLGMTTRSTSDCDVKIEQSLSSLYDCDYRVRSHLFKCIQEKHLTENCMPMQLAICYYIGFGTTRNETKLREVMETNGISLDEVRQTLAHSHPGQSDSVLSRKLDNLLKMGQLAEMQHSQAYLEQGKLTNAASWLLREKEDLETTLGMDHPLVDTVVRSIADVYSTQGRWKDAVELEEQSLVRNNRVLGERHTITLSCRINLALNYRQLSRLDDAEEVLSQALETSLSEWGQHHRVTLSIMYSLTLIYMHKAAWSEAEWMGGQVLEKRERIFGEEHPDTLESLNGLASIYKARHKWGSAEELERRVMELRKRTLGEEHPLTIISRSNLAVTLMRQERWKEAEELGWQAVTKSRELLGEAHSDTLAIIGNLALILSRQNRLEEAEELEEQVLNTRELVLGPKHPETLIALNNRAVTLLGQGRAIEAEELFRKVLDAYMTILGDRHPDTHSCMSNLAHAWRKLSRSVDAVALMRECYGLQEVHLGTDHPDTVESADILQEWEGNSI